MSFEIIMKLRLTIMMVTNLSWRARRRKALHIMRNERKKEENHLCLISSSSSSSPSPSPTATTENRQLDYNHYFQRHHFIQFKSSLFIVIVHVDLIPIPISILILVNASSNTNIAVIVVILPSIVFLTMCNRSLSLLLLLLLCFRLRLKSTRPQYGQFICVVPQIAQHSRLLCWL